MVTNRKAYKEFYYLNIRMENSVYIPSSIYKPLIGRYVKVIYKDEGAEATYGKLIKADLKSLHLSPSAHMSIIEKKESRFGELITTRDIDLEEITKIFSRNILSIVDYEKVREVTDFTKVFEEIGLKLE